MQEQLGINLMTFVAPIFEDATISDFCKLIDEKVEAGLKCDDLKNHLSVLILRNQNISNWAAFKDSDAKKAYDFLESY